MKAPNHKPHRHGILGQAQRFLRLFQTTASERAYLRDLRRSGLFDARHYRRCSPNLHPVSKLFAARHFIVLGEAMGLSPNRDFWPPVYLKNNPDVQDSGLSPFHHYITVGRKEGRVAKVVLQDFPPSMSDENPLVVPSGNVAHRQAVVVHVHYLDLWSEISSRLQSADIKFDLYVTLNEQDAGFSDRILADFPRAWVQALPNRGRDVLPFVRLINTGIFSHYEAVCKLHTKKSPHLQDGAAWRQSLFDAVLPGSDTSVRLQRFVNDPKAGILVSDGQHLKGRRWWGANRDRVDDLLRRIGLSRRSYPLSFPAGSVFWIKPAVLDRVRDLDLKVADFELEGGQVEGTTAHAFERLLGHVTQDVGLSVTEVSDQND